MYFHKLYTRLPHKTARILLSGLILANAYFLAACGQKTVSSTEDYIGLDAAKEAALKAADISADQAALLSAGLDNKNGTFYYQVVFQGNGAEYKYDIDALTGVVIEEKHTPLQSSQTEETSETTSQEKTEPPENAELKENTEPQKDTELKENTESQKDTELEENTESQKNAELEENTESQKNAELEENVVSQETASLQESADSQKNANSLESTESQKNTTNNAIDSNAALSIALSHAGLTEKDITFHQVKTDIENGKQIFEVEFMSSDGTEYDYELSAKDGTILSYDFDAEFQFRNTPAPGTGIISEDQAKKTVLDRVPGASAENMVIRLEEDDGRMEYEGKLFYDNTEYEFKIDAYSGGLMEWDAESVILQ